jgi:hypothetical protein
MAFFEELARTLGGQSGFGPRTLASQVGMPAENMAQMGPGPVEGGFRPASIAPANAAATLGGMATPMGSPPPMSQPMRWRDRRPENMARMFPGQQVEPPPQQMPPQQMVSPPESNPFGSSVGMARRRFRMGGGGGYGKLEK